MRKHDKNTIRMYVLSYAGLLLLIVMLVVPSLVTLTFGETIRLEAYASQSELVDPGKDFPFKYEIETIPFEVMDEELIDSVFSLDHMTIRQVLGDQRIHVTFVDKGGVSTIESASLSRPDDDAYVLAEYMRIAYDDQETAIGIIVSYAFPDTYIRRPGDGDVIEAFRTGQVICTFRILNGRFVLTGMAPA
jgi:hypothetical protein